SCSGTISSPKSILKHAWRELRVYRVVRDTASVFLIFKHRSPLITFRIASEFRHNAVASSSRASRSMGNIGQQTPLVWLACTTEYTNHTYYRGILPSQRRSRGECARRGHFGAN